MTRQEFEHIAIRLHSTATLHARRFVSEKEDIEDVANDTMLKLWALHEDITNETHALKLSTVISRHTAIDLQRRIRREASLIIPFPVRRNDEEDETAPFQIPDSNASAPGQYLEWKEEMAWLKEKIKLLPDREMQVLRMRQKERKSNTEIARIMGIKESSVAVMLSNARKKLFNDIKNRYSQ